MTRPRRLPIVVLILVVVGSYSARAAQNRAPQAVGLKIVVIEGEGAVNIIQQKTAVAPVIEVRDRNDQPVSGALVTFAIQKGHASFNGARALTVTTNAAGRATATGLATTGKGALQIAASAAFQGQTAAISIVQTTVVTAAEASIPSGTGAASAGDGGLSHTAIAGVFAGAGAGVAGLLLASKESPAPTPAPSPAPAAAPTTATFSGPMAGQMTRTLSIGGAATCTVTATFACTMVLTIDRYSDGRIIGSWTCFPASARIVFMSAACESHMSSCFDLPGGQGNISGTVTSFGYNIRIPCTATPSPPNGSSIHDDGVRSFSGALADGAVTGTFSATSRVTGVSADGAAISGTGNWTFPVTLR